MHYSWILSTSLKKITLSCIMFVTEMVDKYKVLVYTHVIDRFLRSIFLSKKQVVVNYSRSTLLAGAVEYNNCISAVPSNVQGMTPNYLMVSLQFWNFREYGVPLH